MKHHALLLAGLLTAAAGSSACYDDEQVYTVVHQDNSVDRAVVQDVALTPESARRPQLWTESRVVKAGPADPWAGSIASLPAPTKKNEEKLFAARGHFASVAMIPDHYLELANDGTTASRLSRTFTSRDLGLVTERVWTETLNDIVNPEEMAKAREALAQINMKLLGAALSAGLGPDYEYDAYVRYVGETSRAFFATFADAALEIRAADEPNAWNDDATPVVVRRVAERHGVAWVADENLDKKAREVIGERTRTLISRRDGRPVDPALADLIAGAVVNIGDNALVSFDARGGESFSAGIVRVAAADYGGAEALEKQAGILYQRMLGITLFDGQRGNSFVLTLPGTIVETNGTLESDSRVRWTFKVREAFAFGYAMRCRSLEPNAAAQSTVPGARKLTDRAAMLRYVSLVGGDKELLDVARQAIAEKRAAPLAAYQSKLAADTQQAGRAANVAKLMALMGITVK